MMKHEMPMQFAHRLMLGCATILIALAHGQAGAAESSDSYPSRPVRAIVPFPAGSGGDAVMRPVAERLSEQIGKPVIIENRPGAGTVIGMNLVAKAPPDGYTLLLATTSLVITPGLMPNLPFDPVKDFTPLMLIGVTPLLLLADPKTNITNVRELLAAARAKPGQLNYSSSGSGGALHLGMELLKSMTGINIAHIPYKGSAEAMQSMIAGDVQTGLNTLELPVMSQVTSGRLRALGITGRSRMETYPQIPTIAESGVPGFEVVSWHGVLAPARMPAAIAERLESELGKALQAPKVRSILGARGMQIEAAGSTAFAAFIGKELEKWTPIVKASGAKMD